MAESNISFPSPLGTIESAHMSKDYTYADQYPVFIDQSKLSLFVGKSISVSRNSFNQSVSLGKPDGLPSVYKSVDGLNTSENGFHYSKYPNSSLNVELEKQCVLAEMYQNIGKIKEKKRLFPPVKVVWNKTKAKPKKTSLRSSSMHMKAVINGDTNNINCPDCNNKRCKCEILDNFCESTWENIKHKFAQRENIYEVTQRSRHIREITSQVRNDNWRFNPYAERIEQRRTRRRNVKSLNYSRLSDDLLSIEPKRIFVKVLDEGDYYDNN